MFCDLQFLGSQKSDIELLMLGFPIARAYFKRATGIESIESQIRQFVFCTPENATSRKGPEHTRFCYDFRNRSK